MKPLAFSTALIGFLLTTFSALAKPVPPPPAASPSEPPPLPPPTESPAEPAPLPPPSAEPVPIVPPRGSAPPAAVREDAHEHDPALVVPVPPKKIGIGGDLQFLLPLGDFSDGAGPLVGPIFRIGYRVLAALEVTGRVGFLVGFLQDQSGGFKSGFNAIPILLGGRYFVFDPNMGPYAALEVGMNLMVPKTDPKPPDPIAMQVRFGGNAGIGYVFSRELPLDVRAQFTVLNLVGREKSDGVIKVDEPSEIAVGVSLGYTAQF